MNQCTLVNFQTLCGRSVTNPAAGFCHTHTTASDPATKAALIGNFTETNRQTEGQ